MTTGQFIKAAREKAGMTQKELADKLGIPYQSVSQWERNTRNPKYDTIRRIATALGVEWTDLVPEEEQGKQVIDNIRSKLAKMGLESNFTPDDKETLKSLLPRAADLEPLTSEESALKILLNSLGYDILKAKGNYFFTYESGGSEISRKDLNELLNCAQNGLKVAAKTLELRLIQETFNCRIQNVPQQLITPFEGKDTPASEKPPEGPQEGAGTD